MTIKILFLLLLTIRVASAASITLNPMQDATLYEDTVGEESGGGADGIFVGRVGTNDPTPLRRGLIEFDFSSIPAGSVINSVSLSLTLITTRTTAAQSITVHRVTNSWIAGTVAPGGGNGGAAMLGDATWLHRSSPTLWNAPGGDFVSAPSATTSVSTLGLYTWSSAQLLTDVQQWFAGTTNNFGWLLLGNESLGQSVKEFASMDNSSGVPALVIDFTAPIPEPSVLALGLILLSAGIRRQR
jgi:hypothetical protein